MKIFSFPCISTREATTLILGTMPGEMSLRMNQYYGHRGNTFWKLMFHILNEPFSEVYDKRVQLLRTNGISLWDVLKACDRQGSADTAIFKEECNDFDAFFKHHPNIQKIAFNGKKAAALFEAFYTVRTPLPNITLPSTSPANGRGGYANKYAIWKAGLAVGMSI